MDNSRTTSKNTGIAKLNLNNLTSHNEFNDGINITITNHEKTSTPELSTSKIEELFNLTLIENLDKPTALNPNLISKRVSRSPSVRSLSQASTRKLLRPPKNAKDRKSPSFKRSSSKASSSARSHSSINEQLEENISIINENVSTEETIEIVKKEPHILENGNIDYNILCPQNKCGDLAKMKFVNNQEKYLVLRIYSNVGNLSMILSEMSNVNLDYYLKTPDENECLPIYYAIKADCLSTVKLLVEKGSSLNKTTVIGDPAPHLACLLGVSVELLDYILSIDMNQLNLYKNDQEGWTILHCACNQGHLDIVKYLLEQKHMNPNVKDGKNRYTGLQLAAMNDHIDVVQYFLTFTSSARITSAKLDKAEKEKSTSAESNMSNAASINSSSYCHYTTVKNISDLNSVNSLIKAKSNLTKQLTSSNNSLLSVSTNKKSVYTQGSNASITYKKFKRKFNMNTQLSVVSSENESLDDNKSEIVSVKQSVVKVNRPKILIDSTMVYFEDENRFKAEPVSVYKNFVIDLNSKNSEGQNVLHTACRFGKYDIVCLLLKKYGSNNLDINNMDLNGKTSLDLAWEWLLNTSNLESSEYKVNMFYDKNASMYIQKNMLLVNKSLDNDLKLIHLLSKYGAKFSDYKHLLYDLETLNEFESDYIDLPSDLFHPFDHVTFKDVKLQNMNIIPIMTYLKCILAVFKLNLPTMFVYEFNDMSQKDLMKQQFAYNLHDLVIFIQKNVIDTIEKKIYYETIQKAFEFLSKF